MSRIRLAEAVASRLSRKLFPHPIIEEILRSDFYEFRTRCLSAAVTRVELDQRRLAWRLVEYAYVWIRLPGRQRVTIGPAQTRLSKLQRQVPHCDCDSALSSPSLFHCLGKHHQALTLLSEMRILCARLGRDRDVINAYNKGADAGDIRLPTVYSEVVRSLAVRYEGRYSFPTTPSRGMAGMIGSYGASRKPTRKQSES